MSQASPSARETVRGRQRVTTYLDLVAAQVAQRHLRMGRLLLASLLLAVFGLLVPALGEWTVGAWVGMTLLIAIAVGPWLFLQLIDRRGGRWSFNERQVQVPGRSIAPHVALIVLGCWIALLLSLPQVVPVHSPPALRIIAWGLVTWLIPSGVAGLVLRARSRASLLSHLAARPDEVDRLIEIRQRYPSAAGRPFGDLGVFGL